jgi:hypothetical protein
LRDTLSTYLGRAILFLLVVFLALEGDAVIGGVPDRPAGRRHQPEPHYRRPGLVELLDCSPRHRQPDPLALLTFFYINPKAVAWACFLIFATFISVRYNFVIPDLAVYKLEGLEWVFLHPRLSTSYTSQFERVVGQYLGNFRWVDVFLLGTRYLPIVNANSGGRDMPRKMNKTLGRAFRQWRGFQPP